MAAPMRNVCDNLFQSIFQSYLSKQSISIPLKYVLGTLESNQLLSSMDNGGSMQEVTSYIHNCLGNSKSRQEGLLLLSTLVRQCSTDVFQQNALTWIKLLIQILQSHCPVHVYQASCRVLGDIIQHSKTFSDLSREITSSVTPQLLPILINAHEEMIPAAIACINKCIRTYPGPVGPFKNKLEASVVQQLDKSTDVEAVHRCYALLSQCGPGGTAGVKHAEAWSVLCDKLIGSLELTMDALYDGLEADSRAQNKERISIELSSIDFDRGDRVTALVSRWKSLTACMVCMLSEEVSTAVKVRADMILQLVYRCLSVTALYVLQKPTSERSLLAAYIPEIHGGALDILKNLISLCRRNLVPHSSNVVSLLCQELVWTQTSNHGYQKQYGALRQKVYEVLTTWMKALDGCSGVVQEETTLVKQILHDCAPFSDTLQLTTEGGDRNKVGDMSSKKSKKKKGYQEISHGISTQRKVHPLCNSELVIAALDALYWLLTTGGSDICDKRLQEIQTFIIQTLFLVQQNREFPVPYSSPSCRRGLYKVLQACVLSPHPKSPPPTQCALQLFSVGSLDKCLEVSSLCLEASRVCEVLIHPRAPCLNGPVICEKLIYIGRTSLEGSVNSVFSSKETDFRETEAIGDAMDEETSRENGDYNHAILKRKRQTIDTENGDSEESSGIKQSRFEPSKIEENTSKTVVENKNVTAVDINDGPLGTDEVVEIGLDSDDDVEIIDEGDSKKSERTDKDKNEGLDEDDSVVAEKHRNDGNTCSRDMKVGHEEVKDSIQLETVIKPGSSKQGLNKEVKTSQNTCDDDNDDDDDDEVQVDVQIDVDTEKSKISEEPDEEVLTMMSAFVDAGPDSD